MNSSHKSRGALRLIGPARSGESVNKKRLSKRLNGSVEFELVGKIQPGKI